MAHGASSRTDSVAAAFGRALRAARTDRGATLQELAEAAGCTKGYLSLIENGRKGPPGDGIVARLEARLNLEAGALRQVKDWGRTPEPVREALQAERARDAERDAVMERLAALSGSLDEAYRSGELRALVEVAAGQSGAGGPAVAAGGSGGLPAGLLGGLPGGLPLEVPVINRVAAGYPAGFTDLGHPARIADDYVRCPDIEDADAFAARVVGDSMEPDYREGDIVVFSPARDIADGDDCFARLEPDDETTFKRVYFEKDEEGNELIRLQPTNSRYAPRTLRREGVAGLYRAVRVIRRV